MEGLDIRVVNSKQDLEELYVLASNLPGCWAERLTKEKDNRYSAVARIKRMPVGFWSGVIDEKRVPDYFNIKGTYFYSDWIFVSEEFWDRGIGSKVKEDQLRFAKKRGCEHLYCEVETENKYSRKIQERFNPRIHDMSEEGWYQYCFDLEGLKL